MGIGYHSSGDAASAIAQRHPGRAVPIRYALGDAASATAAVESTQEAFGRVDGVVANAGVWIGGRLDRISPEDWARVVSDNLTGTAQLCRAAVPALASDPSVDRSITIVSSVVGLIGGVGDTAYSSAKSGLFGLARSLCKELAGEQIRVNVVAPGLVETDMTAQVSDRSKATISEQILLGRFGRPEEVAAAIVYLSEDATYCTGSILTVDGGWSQ